MTHQENNVSNGNQFDLVAWIAGIAGTLGIGAAATIRHLYAKADESNKERITSLEESREKTEAELKEVHKKLDDCETDRTEIKVEMARVKAQLDVMENKST